jgi:hypothetical protein
MGWWKENFSDTPTPDTERAQGKTHRVCENKIE